MNLIMNSIAININLFIAIHSGFQNAGHLLNSMIAENCDMRRNVLSTQPRSDDPYFTAVCEFRKHLLIFYIKLLLKY